jgi:hypothetical protein
MFESLPFPQRVLHALTALDEKKRSRRSKSWNPYFLGIVCRDALPALEEDLANGRTEAEAFAFAFTPAREMHTVARKLGLGLDVDRGRWVLPDGRIVA